MDKSIAHDAYLQEHPEVNRLMSGFLESVVKEKPGDIQAYAKQYFANVPRKAALVIIDVQNDFCSGGSLAVPDANEVIPVINSLRARCKGLFDLVCLTQDWHPADHISFASNHEGAKLFESIDIGSGMQVMWPDHCVQGSRGAEFHADLVREPSDVVVRKGMNKMIDSYSGFMDNDRKNKTELEAVLAERGITDVYIAGLAYDFCAGWSALDAAKTGFRTVLVEDGCRGITPGGVAAMKKSLRDASVSIVQAGQVKCTARDTPM